MLKARPLDSPARLAAHVGASYPGLISRATLADAVAVAEGFEGDDALDTFVSLVDWHVGSPAKLAMMLDMDPESITLSVRRGRRTLGRSGRRPDGSPTVAGSPCRP